MKQINLENGFTIEISEGEELFDFAKTILNNNLYVKGFSLRATLIGLLELFESDTNENEDKSYILRKTKDSFIGLIKFNDEYIGMCAFFKFHACTIQTFIKKDFRGRGIAFNAIKEVLKIVNSKGMGRSISFHHGEPESLVLFYKLWEEELINLYNLVEEQDKRKLRYIKKKLKGEDCSCFMSVKESEFIKSYIKNKLYSNEKMLIGEIA